MSDSAQGLRVESLSKSFGSNRILENISFDLPKGSLLSLLGPSGCGKSTTLNILAGFMSSDSGRILLGDTDIIPLPPNKRDLSLVFQNYALFPHMTVKKNVLYGLKPRRVPLDAAAKRYRTVMDLLNIAHLEDRHPGQLSGGQQQRVALARAIVVEPSLLLLDEPLSNLDAALRREVRTHIRSLQQELSQTAVFVTHDQEEALSISDVIAVLNQGHVEQIGSPEQLWREPETVFVARFMGVENILPIADVGSIAISGSLEAITSRSATGDEQFVGFRPIHAELAEHEEFAPSDERIAINVDVSARSYLGRSVEYVCSPNQLAGQEMKVEVPADRDRGFVRGDQAVLVVHRSNVRLLLAEPVRS